MDKEWTPKEENASLPEHITYPEYTPEYPDVTFFKESYVTMREENIFQGEIPPEESNVQDLREEKKRKRNRESWLRWFLSGLVKVGAALFAITMLVANASAKEDPDPNPDTRARFVKLLGVDLLKSPFTPQQDYTFKELEALWEGDPIAPHQYDYDHLIVLKEPTCQENGQSAYACKECGVLLKHVTTKDHEPAAALQENVIEPGCETDGSYEEVFVCADCGEELSRTKVITPALGHTGADPVIENVVSPTCSKTGSCEEVVYCSACGEEISRTAKIIEATGHIDGDPVAENRIDPTCTEEGSYERVTYCTGCGEEISRVRMPLDPIGHIGKEPVVENTVNPTCTKDGSYDEIIYCSVCGEEMSRTQTTIPATGHTAAKAVIENKKDATCTEAGHYDEVVYCSTCHEEMSRTTKTEAALGHKYKEKVTKPTCTEQGYSTHTCSRCKDSYKDTYTQPLGHNYKDKVTAATCEKQGYTTHTCSRCGDSYKDTYTDAIGHNYTEKTTAPTCTAKGYTTHTCSRCGDSYKDNYVDALGHDFPIAASNRRAVAECSRCGLDGLSFSYVASSGSWKFTVNSAFASALKKAGYSQGDAYVESTSGGWLGESGSWNGGTSGTIPYADLDPGRYTCRLVLMYWDDSQEYEVVSKTKTVTVN